MSTATIDKSTATRIRTLRAIGRPDDAFAWRQSVERALSPSPLRIAGVSPHAIVCVRSLRAAALPANHERWRAALGRRLDLIGRHAARPFHESVPAGALAVLFTDEAELLACLARDCGAGGWWWAALFDEPMSAGLVWRVFIERAYAVAAACELLQQRGILLEVVRHWDDGHCLAVQDAIAATFALPAIGAEYETAPAGEVATRHTAPPRDLQAQRAAATAVLAAQLGDMSNMTMAQRLLVTTVTLLRKAPALARTPGLIGHVSAPAMPPRVPAEPLNATAQTGPAGVRSTPAPPGAQPPSINTTVEQSHRLLRFAGDTTVALAVATGQERETAAMVAPSAMPVIRTAADERMSAAPGEVDQDGVDRFESAYAGVVYLINLALYLGLYGDFTKPRAVECPLPLGELLARIAERACGGAVRDEAIGRLFVALGAVMPDADASAEADHERSLNTVWPQLAAAAASAMQMREDTVLRFLCETAGRIELAPTRVDAYFALATHAIDIRIAGLDRDPGWVPAAGRIVAFHYE